MMEDINIKLRSLVLDNSLKIESCINNALLLTLSVSSEKRKALSLNSSSLSFKGKIDLLHDIKILDDCEYRFFLTAMEIRNKFMHNVSCSSFLIAINLLGKDKEKFLSKFKNEINIEAPPKEESEKEKFYFDCYNNLTDIIIIISIRMIKRFTDEQNIKRDFLINVFKFVSFLSEKHFELSEVIDDFCKDMKEIDMSTYSPLTDTIEELKTHCSSLKAYKEYNKAMIAKMKCEKKVNSYSVVEESSEYKKLMSNVELIKKIIPAPSSNILNEISKTSNIL